MTGSDDTTPTASDDTTPTASDDAVRSANEATLRKMMEYLAAEDFDGIFTLWGDDSALELPFMPNHALRRVEGKDNVQAFFKAVNGNDLGEINLTVRSIMPMLDPNAFFAEYTGEATVKATGGTYCMDYLGFFRFSDGKIVLWREYYDAVRAILWNRQDEIRETPPLGLVWE
ncbi:MAG TPA: nuclear transport factor 2 family protein [Acidimicrobiales bacterium]|nr:nuclear transport factor 2 family protein [Acidimicrobiales bacterium]